MIENMTYNFGLLKSWKASQNLTDLSPNHRHWKIIDWKSKNLSDRIEIKIGEIASATNSSYKKLAFQWLISPASFCSSAVYADSSALRNKPTFRSSETLGASNNYHIKT